MEPVETINRYFAAVRARNADELMTLYADEACFTLPDGRAFTGHEAIRQMHEQVFTAGAPMPTPVGAFSADLGQAIQIEAELPDGSVRKTANFYKFDRDGRIAAVTVYAQGG